MYLEEIVGHLYSNGHTFVLQVFNFFYYSIFYWFLYIRKRQICFTFMKRIVMWSLVSYISDDTQSFLLVHLNQTRDTATEFTLHTKYVTYMNRLYTTWVSGLCPPLELAQNILLNSTVILETGLLHVCL